MGKNMFDRSAGVLLNISSLPGAFGIGDFGEEAINFAKKITKGQFYWWQVLPITALGMGDCPYNSVSSFAGNYLYISPDYLKEEGLIGEKEYLDCMNYGEPYTVNYTDVANAKKNMLGVAFARGKESLLPKLKDYVEANKWLDDYALFMTIKSINNIPWWLWSKELRDKNDKACKSFKAENYDTYLYYVFEQYIFTKHWERCKAGINAAGVGVIGDMPIYVNHDSVDVWANKKDFLLDDEFLPNLLAGCPPDYFSAEGQLWGNPVYNYAAQRENGYSWWLERFARMFELYDCLRIDHFRGFDKFWAVDRNEKTAVSGKWMKADGGKIFSLVKKKFPDKKIIAEDLGTLDKGVTRLLTRTGFPGMKVAQFAFSDGDSNNLPHYYDTNCVAYTGTHDNDTTLGWLFKLPEEIRNYTLSYIGCEKAVWGAGGFKCKSTLAMISTLIKSSASLVVFPLQDLCGYGSDTRMNIPGVAEGNWRFRATQSAIDCIDYNTFSALNGLYGRARKVFND